MKAMQVQSRPDKDHQGQSRPRQIRANNGQSMPTGSNHKSEPIIANQNLHGRTNGQPMAKSLMTNKGPNKRAIKANQIQ